MEIQTLTDDQLANIFASFDPGSPTRCERMVRIWSEKALGRPITASATFDVAAVKSTVKGFNFRATWIASELVEATKPTELVGYNQDRKTWRRRQRLFSGAVIGLGVLAAGLVARACWAGIRYFQAERTLWTYVPKRLPNGDLELTMRLVNRGGNWIQESVPVMVKAPTELSVADRAFYHALSANSKALVFRAGLGAATCGAFMTIGGLLSTCIPEPGKGLEHLDQQGWDELTNLNQQDLGGRILREGLLSERVTAQFLRLEQVRSHLQEKGPLTPEANLCLATLYNHARRRDQQDIPYNTKHTWKDANKESRIAYVYQTCIRPLAA